MRLLKILAKTLMALVACLAIVACAQVMRNSGAQSLPSRDDSALRMASYNVHYIVVRRSTGPWSLADWERRKEPLDLAFKSLEADLIGFQEMESFGGGSGSAENLTLEWLLARNPAYLAAAVGDPSEFPSTQPILYRADRLDVRDQGWFFFSDTPDEIYARTFNGSYPAFASWAQFEDRNSGSLFRVVNLHTDFSSRSNRLQSMELVAERIAPWIEAAETLFVIGDFNARRGDRTLAILEEMGLRFVPSRGASYHFNRGLNLFGAIDHIGYIGAAVPNGDAVILRRKFAGEWPTDHYPLVADVTISN